MVAPVGTSLNVVGGSAADLTDEELQAVAERRRS
jgi:hypothetical protein